VHPSTETGAPVATDVIHLTARDDIAIVREMIQGMAGGRLIFVVPDGVPTLRSLVTMKLIRRYAEQNATHVMIVTSDGVVAEVAREAGLLVRSALPTQEEDWRWAELDLVSAGRPAGSPTAARRVAVILRRGLALTIILSFALPVILVGLLGASSAEVILYPAFEPLAATIAVKAGPDVRAVNSAARLVPAQTVQVTLEETLSAETTGRKRAPDKPATGTVVFANRGATSVIVPKGTVVRTGTGVSIRFRTEEEATVPIGPIASVRVPVQALDPGPSGNVRAGTVTVVEGPIGLHVTVLNDEDFSGGTEREVRYVTLNDRTVLRTTLMAKVQEKGLAELQRVLPAEQTVITPSATIVVHDAVFDHNANEEASILTLRMRATVSVLVVSMENITRLAADHLTAQAREGFFVPLSSVRLSQPMDIQVEPDGVRFQVRVQAQSVGEIDSRRIQQALAGVTRREALHYLQGFALARPPEVNLALPVLDRLPLLGSRIHVDIRGPEVP